MSEIRGRLENAQTPRGSLIIEDGTAGQHVGDAIDLLAEVDRLKAENAAIKNSLVGLMNQAEAEIHDWLLKH